MLFLMTLSNFHFIGSPIASLFLSPDLSCVSYMPYLLELNASQNKLTTFFDFKPPKNLKVDLFSIPVTYANWFAKYIDKQNVTKIGPSERTRGRAK